MTRPTATPSASNLAVTPALRFPEFRKEPGWTSKELHTIAEPVSERADNEDQNNILTLSGEHGLVLQSEYFGKQIAGANSERYLKIHRDDFVYNDRTTKASEYGTIKRLTKHPHGIVSPIYKCFRFRAGELPVFWEWYFESGAHQAQLRSLANEGARAGRFNVSIDRFLSTSVCTPERGSKEQQKIAECLSTLDELIGAESQKLDTLKAHKKGLMQQLFPREGETLPRLRFPEFKRAGKWEKKRVDALGDVLTGKALAVNGSGPLRPYLRTKNVLDGAIDLLDVLSMPMTDAEFSRFEILPGDILLNEGQSLELVGRASIYRGEFKGRCAMQNQLLRFRAFPETSREFAGQVFRKCQQDGTFAAIATKTTSIAHLGSSRFSALELAWPSSPEQQRIATCLSSLDELIAAQSDRLSALQTHEQGLLQQLFPSPNSSQHV
jgi:type I restriction enzyme S subunit